MKSANFAFLLLALTAASCPGADPDGGYVIRLEAPFSNAIPDWLPLRLEVNVAGGKPVQAVATAIHRNRSAHPVDLSGLQLAGGRFTGTATVAFHSDDYQRARGQTVSVPAQVLTLDVPVGAVSGAAPGSVTWDKDVDNARGKPGRAPGRAWRVTQPNGSQTQYAEFQIMRWDDRSPIPGKNAGGQLDGMLYQGALLLRCTIRNGVASDWICLQAPERYLHDKADLFWKVEGAQVTFADGKLTGSLNLAGTDDQALRELATTHPKYAALPGKPLPVTITAQVIGSILSGTATIAHTTPTTSAVLGSVRSAPFALHADRALRTWKLGAEPDPALVQAAQAEALKPIRPGEPGQHEFWSDPARWGGFDILEIDGQKVAKWDRNSVSIEEAWAKTKAFNRKAGWLACIAPPTFNIPDVPGAVRYRFTLGKESCELPHPWSAPVELWQRTGPGDQNLVIQGLDAAGAAVGQPATVRVARRPSFQGPYHGRLPRSYRDAALLSARWLRDHPVNTQARINTGFGACWYPNGDDQLWYTTYAGLYAGLVLAELSPDADERAAGLDLAVTIADTWLRFFANNYLPDTYKGWTFDQWVYGCAWLDLHRLTGDPRYQEAVLVQARRITAHQLASGGFGEIGPDGAGGASVDPKTGVPFIHSLHAPSMQQWDPSSILYLLGRIRKDLKTDEFRPAEAKTWQWLQKNSIARFDWRRQGPNESSHHKIPWPVMADCALHCYEYLALDLPGAPSEPALMEDLLRWIEDQEVDWRRQEHPSIVSPRMTKLDLSRDVQPRFALACARQAQRTGSALWRAKAEALAGTVVIAQCPNSGQIPPRAPGRPQLAPLLRRHRSRRRRRRPPWRVRHDGAA